MSGTKLRTYREAADITIERMADAVGIDTCTLSGFERNERKPKRQ